MKRFNLLLLLMFAPFLLFASHALGQNSQSYLNDIGSTAYGVNIPVENGFINISNGNLHLEFPLASPAQRGTLRVNERLVYDSRIWMFSPFGTNGSYHWWPYNIPGTSTTSGGWQFIRGDEVGSISYGATTSSSQQCESQDPDYGHDTYDVTTTFQITWTEPDGVAHPTSATLIRDFNECGDSEPDSISAGSSLDGSGVIISDDGTGNPLVKDNNGEQVYPQVIDRFGNYFATDAQGNLQDDTGRVPVIVTQNGGQTFYDVLSPGGNIQNNGPRSRYTVTTSPVSVSTNFNQSDTYEWVSGSDLTPIQSIQLPDGSQYSFTYDGYGEMSSITLPTGGTIQYGYGNFLDSANTDNRWLETRTVGSNPAMTMYPRVLSTCSNYSTGCKEVMRVTAPSGDTSVYELTLANGAWNTAEAIYTGAPPSSCVGPIPRCSGNTSSILSYTTNTYTYSNACSGANCAGANYVTSSLATTELWANGSVTVYKQTQSAFDPTSGKPTSIKQWDFQPDSGNLNTTSPPSTAPLLETDYTYTNAGHDPYQVTVKDGSGNQVALTTYSYTGSAIASSGLPQHGAQNSEGSYLQSIAQWVNNGSTLTTSYAMDDAGVVQSVTSPNGTSTLAYDSSESFLKTTTPPTPSSGARVSSGATPDPNTGVTVAISDYNSQTTIISRFDPFGNPQEIDYPDGGKETYLYTPTQTGNYIYQNASAWTDTETLYDAFGRTYRTATATGGGTTWGNQQDTCYDANYRVSYVSIPYVGNFWQGGANCSAGGTTYAYDGLNRVTATTNPDGTTINHTYGGRATKTSDENQVTRISQTDALGRLTAVCEVSSNSNMPGSGAPQDCGLDLPGSGFLTTYAYDLANHKTIVTQGVQRRVFQTDSVGRQIYVQQPESGATTYSYAYNPTGLLITRQRPLENQTDPTVLTNTDTQYDSLGRVVGVTYHDGITTNKVFNYDVSAGWSEFAQTNLLGRLSLAISFFPGMMATGVTTYGYDAMGRITGLHECVPSICGVTSRGLTYAYDWEGNLLSSSDGAGVTTYYNGYDQANRVNSMTSSLNNGTNPGTLISNASYGVYGALSYQLGNGLNVFPAWDGMGRGAGSSLCAGSTQSSCSGGVTIYNNSAAWSGNQLKSSSDSIQMHTSNYGYDEFGRLTSETTTSGSSPEGYNWTYDRYGNRQAQELTQGVGYSPNFSPAYDVTTNHSCATCFDAVGNMTTDMAGNSLTYDAEGNVIQVGSVKYTYDALNNRIRIDSGTSATEYVFNANGQRVSVWDPSSEQPSKGQYYWGTVPLGYYDGNGTHFQHQDWLGTERIRTLYNGSPEGLFTSAPFGDNYQAAGYDTDPYHFATLDQDSGGLSHAQQREYSTMQGNWLSPDPYDGSYDFNNPQSFNRYSYVSNNPMSLTDPEGLEALPPGAPGAGFVCPWCAAAILGAEAIYDIGKILGWWSHPTFTASHTPRPSNSNKNWLNSDTFAVPYQGLLQPAIQAGCEFGACGSGFAPDHQTASGPNLYAGIISDAAWLWALHADRMGVHGLYTYGNWCGAGGSGNPTGRLDAACLQHDFCYFQGKLHAGDNITGSNAALQGCNQALCDVAGSVLNAENRQGGNLDEAGAALDVKSYFSGFGNIVRSGNRCR